MKQHYYLVQTFSVVLFQIQCLMVTQEMKQSTTKQTNKYPEIESVIEKDVHLLKMLY